MEFLIIIGPAVLYIIAGFLGIMWKNSYKMSGKSGRGKLASRMRLFSWKHGGNPVEIGFILILGAAGASAFLLVVSRFIPHLA